MSILSNIVELTKIKKTKIKRNPNWNKIRKQHLEKNPYCFVCGGKKKLEVHHILPFSNDPSKELDENNLITLCESASYGIICHLCVGHCGNYQKYNPNVLSDALNLREMFKKSKN